MHQLDRYRRDIGRLGRQRRYGFCEKPHSLAVRRAASARIRATLPQRQAARIVIRHPFNPAPHPQHHRWLALQQFDARPEPSRCGGHAHSNFGQRAKPKNALSIVASSSMMVGGSSVMWGPFSNLFPLTGCLKTGAP